MYVQARMPRTQRMDQCICSRLMWVGKGCCRSTSWEGLGQHIFMLREIFDRGYGVAWEQLERGVEGGNVKRGWKCKERVSPNATWGIETWCRLWLWATSPEIWIRSYISGYQSWIWVYHLVPNKISCKLYEWPVAAFASSVWFISVNSVNHINLP